MRPCNILYVKKYNSQDIVSFAAVFRVVTQRSCSQTAHVVEEECCVTTLKMAACTSNPAGPCSAFFSFIIILNSILVQIFKRLFTVRISNAANREANIKQEIIMMAFTPMKCYGKYHRFCFLQKFNNRSRNNESHEKLPPAKSVMAWLILHFPGTYWYFYFAKAKLHHDGAVTFTVAVTSWKIEYYGKVTFASSRNCCCAISFEQQKNDGAFLAKFKKCYESRSQYEGGNCCCILSQKCKFTFYLLISQSLSMFWRCSRAATIAVGIWLGYYCRP